jgi:hypothetical protein
LRVTGGRVSPSQGPNSPDGELIVANGTAPTFIAFYESSGKAQRLEPEVIHNAKQFGGRVMRRGAETVVWTRRPAASRDTVETCLRG